MRGLLLDEPSMVSAELFAELERRASQAARGTGTYKLRPDKSARPFGGFNVLLFGDWWQIRPAKQTPLTEGPRPTDGGWSGCFNLLGSKYIVGVRAGAGHHPFWVCTVQPSMVLGR